MRNTDASPITVSVIDAFRLYPHGYPMFGKHELLAALKAKGVKQADMARALKLAPPRITELYKDERDLSLDEAKILVDQFGVEDEPIQQPALSERVSRLLVLHVATQLAQSFDPADERVEGLAQDLLALTRFARDHDHELSEDAAQGFLSGAVHARQASQPPQRRA